MFNYTTFGNVCQAVGAASVLLYTIVVLFFANPGSKVFDQQFVTDGYCIINKDIPYWSSHDLCFYWDVLLVMIGGIVYHALKDSGPAMKESDEIFKFTILSHLMHAMAHGFLGHHDRTMNEDEKTSSIAEKYLAMGMMELTMNVLVGLAFWFVMLKAIMYKTSNSSIALASIPAFAGIIFVRTNMTLGYVQAVIAMAAASEKLNDSKVKKNFDYCALSVASMAISLVPWIESMACESVASKFGGHLMYDLSIPIFFMVAYVMSWMHFNKDSNGIDNNTEENRLGLIIILSNLSSIPLACLIVLITLISCSGYIPLITSNIS